MKQHSLAESVNVGHNALTDLFGRNQIFLTGLQAEQFQKYHAALLSWNPRLNLISRADERRVITRHFLESASLAFVDGLGTDVAVLDLGTGAGFPGIPLKIVNPSLDLVLLESKRLKTIFLRRLVNDLSFHEVGVLWARAEDPELATSYHKRFDYVVSRAVAALPKLYELSRPFLRSGGKLVCIKGSSLESEVRTLQTEHVGISVRVEPLLRGSVDVDSRQKVVCVEGAQETN